jgi:hypothetical protein
MDTLPDFVTDSDTDQARRGARRDLTGWETVVFQLDAEPEPEPGPDSSTAAFAP